MDDTRLGTILLESRLVEENELERCLEIQSLTGGARPLGQILIEQGLITGATLDDLLALQDARHRDRRHSLPLAEGEDRYFRTAAAVSASELVVSEGRPVLLRVAGEWRSVTAEPLNGPEVWQFVRDEMGAEVLEELADRKQVSRDFVKAGMARGRITAFRHFDGVAVMVKLHPEEVRTPDECGIPPALLDIARSGKGLVLLTGTAGCGLTETLATLLQEVAKDESRYVLVLDDNLEYPTPSSKAIVVRRRVGVHVSDYVSALRTAVREEQDVILVGDVSEPEAFEMALRAAEGGRLVIASLHASSVIDAMHRILNFYPSYDIGRVRTTLASVLRGILVKQLVPNRDHTAWIPATELLIVDDAARDVVRSGKLSNLSLLMRMDDGDTAHTMDGSLIALLRQGEVRFEDVFGRAEQKAAFLDLVRRGKD